MAFPCTEVWGFSQEKFFKTCKNILDFLPFGYGHKSEPEKYAGVSGLEPPPINKPLYFLTDNVTFISYLSILLVGAININ